MENIIIVFPRIEDGKSIKGLLFKNGFKVDVVCQSGAFALEQANNLNGGVVISGYKLNDMMYSELAESLPPQFELLLLASERMLAMCPDNIMSISMPIKTHDFVNTLHMMFEAQYRKRKAKRKKPAPRSEEQQNIIDSAKKLLMERNHMTEDEAHKYLQKCSMDSGTGIVESAQMVLSLFNT